MTSEQKNALSIVYGCFALLFSLALIPYFTEGDQIQYRQAYNDIGDMDLIDGYIQYQLVTNGVEPVYYFICWIFSGILSKDILISCINAVLAYSIAYWALSNNVSRLLLASFLLNYYTILLFFAAERLKIGVLLFTLAQFGKGNWKFILVAISPLGHSQLAILVASYLSSLLIDVRTWSSGKGRHLRRLFLRIVAAIVVVYIFDTLGSHIFNKVLVYIDLGGALGVVKPLFFILAALFYSKTRRSILLIGLPVLFGAAIVGSDRITIFAYGIFLYSSIVSGRSLNIITVLSSIFFTIKGILFLIAGVNTGDGFNEVSLDINLGDVFK